MSEAKNKKAPSEGSEEVLLIHCTSPTTGSPTDREVIESEKESESKMSKANDTFQTKKPVSKANSTLVLSTQFSLR